MRRLIALSVALAAVPMLAQAQYYQPYKAPTFGTPSYTAPTYQAPRTTSAYDWQSGNSYTTTQRPDGSSTTNGYNVQNGSMWNSQTNSRGNTTGTDSKGNFWSYDQRSGTYMNSNGTICTGTGYGRVCN